MLDIFIYLSPGIFLYLACTCMQLNATLASCSFTCTAGSLLSQGMTHCLLVMEFHRFLPQCRLSVRGLCNVGGAEGMFRLGLALLQRTSRGAAAACPTFGVFLQNDGGLTTTLYSLATILYATTSICQVRKLALRHRETDR